MSEALTSSELADYNPHRYATITDDITVTCGRPNKIDLCLIQIRQNGEVIYEDRDDPLRGDRRAKICPAVCRKADLVDDDGEPLGNAINEIDEKLRAAANVVEQIESQFKPILFGQLRDDHPDLDEPIIDGLLRRCETANIVSGSKVGKSWLSYCLALNVISGRKFLDRFACTAGRVLLIDNELRKQTIAHRIPAVASCMGVPEVDLRMNLDVWSLRGGLLDLYAIIRGLQSVEPRSYQLIILDAWYRSLPIGVSENDNAQVMQLYNEIDRVAERLECGWINIHHSSKGSQGEKSVTDVGAGAGSQSRCVDAHIIFRQHQEPDAIVLDGALRSFAPIEPMVLRWQFPLWMPDDSLDPAKLKGKITASEQRQGERDGDGITKLATALNEGSATVSVLRGRTGLSKHRCERLLDQLEANGSVCWSEITVRGNVCREYSAVNLDKQTDEQQPF